MEFSSPNLEIKRNFEFGANCLQFNFKGTFTERASILGTQAWSEEFDLDSDVKFTLLWDCTEMSGFEPSARSEWYRCMKLHKHRIEEIVVVSRSILIRSAAKVMLNFFGVNGIVVKSHDELLVEAY